MITDISEKLIELAPHILSGIAAAGVGLTAYLAVKAKPDSDWELDIAYDELEDIDHYEDGDPEAKKEVKKETTKKLIKIWAPAVISGIITVVCILASNYISTSRQAALASLLSVSQSALLEYKDTTREVLGKEAAKKVNDQVQINKADNMTVGPGEELFYESLTGQVFAAPREFICNTWKSFVETEKYSNEESKLYLSKWLFEIPTFETSDLAEKTYWRYDPEYSKGLPEMSFVADYTRMGKLVNRIVYDREPDSCLRA